MDRARLTAIALGGAIGATARWAVVTALPVPTGFPWPVFLVNVIGSVIVGVALAEEVTHPRARLLLRDGVGIGFCGGLTTFSTFAVEVVDLSRADRTGLAAVYLVASVVAAVAAVVLGAAAFRQVRAVTRPLEGEP